jgi:hypothetical protein
MFPYPVEVKEIEVGTRETERQRREVGKQRMM